MAGMDLSRLVAEARPDDGAAEEWPFRIAALDRDLDEALADPDALRHVCVALSDAAHSLGCDAVAGASRLGERLAGAVVVSSGNGLKLFSREKPGQTVLILDGVMATGAQVAQTARRVLEAGADRVAAAVVLADPSALELCRQEVGADMVALQEF